MGGRRGKLSSIYKNYSVGMYLNTAAEMPPNKDNHNIIIVTKLTEQQDNNYKHYHSIEGLMVVLMIIPHRFHSHVLFLYSNELTPPLPMPPATAPNVIYPRCNELRRRFCVAIFRAPSLNGP